MRVLREIIAAITMVMIGQLMEIDPNNLLYVLMINPIIAMLLHVARRIKEKFENEDMTETTENREDNVKTKSELEKNKNDELENNEKNASEPVLLLRTID